MVVTAAEAVVAVVVATAVAEDTAVAGVAGATEAVVVVVVAEVVAVGAARSGTGGVGVLPQVVAVAVGLRDMFLIGTRGGASMLTAR
jgi:hypothetical protein